MSDVDWIFVVIIGLYLIESMVWLKQGVTVFTRFLGKFRSPLAAIRLIGNDFGALVLGGPAPWDASFLCEPLPISMSPEGVVPFVPASPLQPDRRLATGLMFTWDDLKELRKDELTLLVKNQFVCKLRNHRTASHLHCTLRHIASLEPEGREPLVANLIADALDKREIGECYQNWLDHTSRLRVAASLLFFWTIPLGIVLYYDLIPIPQAKDIQFTVTYFAIFAAIWLWSILESFLAHRKLVPHDRIGRYKMLFTSIVSPAVPMRAPDRLAREIYLFVHPIAFAAALNDPVLLRGCAENTVRDLEYPRLPELPKGISELAASVVNWSTVTTKAQIRRLLEDAGLHYDQLLAPPSYPAAEAKSFCPRCHDDFTAVTANCSRCGNRTTVSFPEV